VTPNISRMPGPPARALVADHHYVARVDEAIADRRKGVLLAIEDARRPAVVRALVARHLQHAALGARLPRRITRPPVGRMGSEAGRTTFCPGVSVASWAWSRHGLPSAARGLAVHALARQEALDHQAHASGPIEIHRRVLAAGLQVGDQRRPTADGVEVVDAERGERDKRFPVIGREPKAKLMSLDRPASSRRRL